MYSTPQQATEAAEMTGNADSGGSRVRRVVVTGGQGVQAGNRNLQANFTNIENQKVTNQIVQVPPGERTQSNGDNRSGEAAGGLGFVIVVIIIIFLALSGASSGTSLPKIPFPSHGDRWPAGATTEAVMAPALSALRACAAAPVLTPVNCPQAQPDVYSDSVNVQWSLHGNPADGAKVKHWRGKFYVAGNAVMEVSYSDTLGDDSMAIQVVHYRAYLLWRNKAASLISIIGVSAASGPVIAKNEPTVAIGDVKKAVLAAFKSCAASKSAPLPTQCPTASSSDIAAGAAHWRLTADPLLNIHESFDTSSGLIHVTGSFAMEATYSDTLMGSAQNSNAGNYDAIVSIDGTQPEVLEITAS
jgi:hypothetical protein